MTDLHNFPGATVTVTRTCPFCGSESTVTVPKDGYVRWIDGAMIQDAMPEVSEQDREVLKTGICCWDTALPPEED